MSKNVAILDNALGDNGKGRVAAHFSPKFDWCVRFNGSSNSGHQVYRNNKRYTHHLLPSVDYTKSKAKSFLGFGMMINPEDLLREILTMEEDFPGIGKTIYVDPDTFIITAKNVEQDRENIARIGSTGKGVSPAVVDKVDRNGTRFYHLLRDKSEITRRLLDTGVNFVPILKLREEFETASILFEGAQSALLDINIGPYYPYCTSSDCTISGIYSSGFNFIKLDKIYGCMKPYLTFVGKMRPATECPKEEGDRLRELGKEYGSTTGRPRGIAYLDLVALKYGTIKAGINALIITKMDILNTQIRVKVCSSYGKEVFSPCDFIDGITPEYIDLPGWKDAKNKDQIMPFVKYVESFIGVPVEYISAGVNTDDMINLK